MGWMFSTAWSDRKSIIRHLIRNESDDNRTRTCLAHCLRGNVLWTVWEINRHDDTTKRYIGCDLLQNGGAGEGWGYKDMDESCAPFYYTCPMKYLNMVPEVANQEWRDEVIRQANIKSLKVEVGDLVGLDDRFAVKVVQIVRKTSKGSMAAKDRDGREFNINRSYLSGKTFATWPATS